jgi:hypothetical protein
MFFVGAFFVNTFKLVAIVFVIIVIRFVFTGNTPELAVVTLSSEGKENDEVLFLLILF